MDVVNTEQDVVDHVSSGRYEYALRLLNAWSPSPLKDWYQATCFYRLQNYRASAAIYERLLLCKQFTLMARLRLGLCLHWENRLEEALSAFLPSLAELDLRKDVVMLTLIQYGNLSIEMGLASHYIAVLKALPSWLMDVPDIRFLFGISSLCAGSYRIGWDACEARFDLEWGKFDSKGLPCLTPEDLGSCSHLVFCEEGAQGFGDLFFMLRCVPLLLGKGCCISFVGSAPLLAFARATGWFEEVSSSIDLLSHRPTHALPAMSAPFVLGLHSPQQFPSLCLDLSLENDFSKAVLRDRVCEEVKRPLIALNWQGNMHQESPHSMGVRGRSFSISELEEIDSLKLCELISVQVGDAASQMKGSSLEPFLLASQAVLDDQNRDFMATAAALLQVDLLITNDTSVAHLGGLLGVPTWVVLKCHPYWQWGDQGETNVWYPSVRCFRQDSPLDWSSAMKKVDMALFSWLQNWSPPPEIQGSPDL